MANVVQLFKTKEPLVDTAKASLLAILDEVRSRVENDELTALGFTLFHGEKESSTIYAGVAGDYRVADMYVALRATAEDFWREEVQYA